MQRATTTTTAAAAGDSDPWAIPDLTPEQSAALDREIAERGLAEPALCCCEYSEPAGTTGSRHVSHHCCDCSALERHACTLFALFAAGRCDAEAWGRICAALADKSLLPFPGGAIKVPLEGLALLACYCLASVYASSFALSAPHAAIATVLALFLIGWLNVRLASRWRRRTEVFTAWFLLSVLHDVRVLLRVDFADPLAPSRRTVKLLLFSGATMLALLFLTRRAVSSAALRQRGARFEEDGQGHIEYFVEVVAEGSGVRSKHCRLCDHRLNAYDHHCAFINACVAGRNHRYFLAFLGFAVINSMAFSWVDYSYHASVLTSAASYNLILSVFLALLLGFQCALVSVNLTTNEFINRSRYARFRGGKSPHSRGCLANWGSFLAGSRHAPRDGGDLGAQQPQHGLVLNSSRTTGSSSEV
jgi:hypothetical protein